MDNLTKILFACLLLLGSAFAKEIQGVNIPEVSANLKLQGTGVREKFFFDLYVGALYLQTPKMDAKEILEADEQMGLKLHIISSMITSQKMEDATREGFENSLGKEIDSLKNEIEAFISVFKEEIKIGDVYDLVYTPNVGVDIYKNTIFKKTIPSLAFKKALFGIWLGEKPAQQSLKDAMLGK
jgi:hypothetical protein